jgi:hypothetical protein
MKGKEMKKDKKEDLQEFVTWEDFLALASKVREQEEMIKIAFNNGEILKNELKEKELQIKYLYGRVRHWRKRNEERV